MSTRDLFGSKKILSSTNLEEKFADIESTDNARQQIIKKNRFVPQIDFTSASNFAFFGSAEEYYRTAMENIADRYPYDGSFKEKTEFLNSSSYIDLYLLDNVYPRTNGHAIFSSDGWGSQDSTADGYGLPSSLEYISIRGTMNTASDGMASVPLASTFANSNLYQSDIYSNAGVQALGRVGTRGNNLKFDMPQGLSVEFWLKKDAWITGSTNKEVVFDLWNGQPSSSAGYGRFTLFLTGTDVNEGAWKFNVYSGTVGASNVGTLTAAPLITQTTATVGDGNWHHYAFTFKSGSDGVTVKSYRDGALADTIIGALNLQEVTGALQARIGALITSPSGSTAAAGAGKLSASLDDFRYWKSERTTEEIAKFYWTDVGGGTNTDIANTELGVYYKFNEGITTVNSTDSVVLDYSGRITNGSWYGYPGASARSTDSAMVLSGKAAKEFKDPIVYKTHADYISTLNSLIVSGSVHDDQNTSYLYRTIPGWVLDEDEVAEGNIKKLMQIMGNTFDQFYLQTKEYTKFQNVTYGIPTAISASLTGSKTFPHNDRILQSYGFDTDELFIDQTFLEYFANRNNNREFDLDINEVKNQIYKHIYNNLIYLYKSKGTEKSVRNLLRCIGLPESVLKLNAHSNNNTFTFENKFVNNTEKKKYINFYNSTTFNSTLFQSASSNVNTRDRNYVSGAINDHAAFTAEVNVVFPKKLEIGDPGYFETSFITSSIFGMHIVPDVSTFDWTTATSDDKNFRLFAIRPDKYSKDAKFTIIDREGQTIFTSGLYKEVYDNSEWTFAVSVYNDKYAFAGSGSDALSGSATVQHKISLRGYNTEGYYTKNSFELVSDLAATSGSTMLTSNKRYYAGADRENCTGTVQVQTDVKIGYIRHYNMLLDNETISIHAKDRQNFGVSSAARNEYLLRGQTATGSYIPSINLLELNVDFETVTGSDSAGNFLAIDFSSGSTTSATDIRNLYPEIGTNIATQYEFTGYSFPASSTTFVKNEPMLGADFQMPEIVNSSELINVLTRDDELFTKDPSVFSMNFALEKSYNAVISKQMLDFFGSVKVFNDAIGEISANYRDEYSALAVLRTLFFDKITSLTDFNKFYEYYKWIDDSILNFVSQLLPESANFENNVRNLIESHLLERNKIRYKYPLLDFKGNRRLVDPTLEARVQGIAVLDYNWKFGHAPPGSTDQTQNTIWWAKRAKATDGGNTSGDTVVDKGRQSINIVDNNVNAKLFSTLRDNNGNKYYAPDNTSDSIILTSKIAASKKEVQIHGGLNSNFVKSLGIFRNSVSAFYDKATPRILNTADSQVFSSDDAALDDKPKRSFGGPSYKSEFILPGTIVSSSIESGYQSFNVSKTDKIGIQNIHLDVIDNLDVAMQGPYTEAHVGGLQHRHQDMNRSSSVRSLDTALTRPEGFKIAYDSTNLVFAVPQAIGTNLTTYNADIPFAIRVRDEYAKRPVSIRNIKTTTGSFVLGNYQRSSEILLLSGRTANNHVFAYNDGFGTGSIVSSYITGAADYTKPVRYRHRGEIIPGQASASTQHVIVNRFAAPGGPEVGGDNQGGPGLDYEAAEFSPYNNLNYRNLTVRRPLNLVYLANHSNYGGFFSSGSDGYPGIPLGNSSNVTPSTYMGSSSLYGIDNATASFHKVNRNPRRVAYQTSSVDFSTGTLLDPTRTKKVYDNAYVATNIPGSDFQYAWITASYISSNIISYQSQDGLVSTSVGLVNELTFLSASDVGSGITAPGVGALRWVRLATGGGFTAGTFVPVDFAGMNTAVIEPHSGSSFSLGYPPGSSIYHYINYGSVGTFVAGATDKSSFIERLSDANNQSAPLLNAILSHRQGPYGHPTWKQIRVGEGQLGRYYRKNNFFTYTPQPGSIFTNGAGQIIRNKYGATVMFTQSVLTSKFPPVEMSVDSNNGNGIFTNNQIYAEHGNDKVYLSRESDNLKLNLFNNSETAYNLVNNLYIKDPSNFVAKGMIYKEVVWPREENTYLAKSRQRTGYTNNFWRDTAANRQTLGDIQKDISATRPGFGAARSAWDLDVYPEFSDFTNVFKDTGGSTGLSSPTILNAASFGNAGMLQNYTTFNRYNSNSGVSISASMLRVEPTYNRPQMLQSIRSVVSPNGMDIMINATTRISDAVDGSANSLNKSFIGSGQAKWEAGAQAGKYVTATSSDGSTTTSFVVSARKPFYDSYGEYVEDISIKAKDYAIIPEYRRTDFVGKENDIINLTDFARIVQSTSDTTPINSSQDDFYTVFSNTDFMKYFEVVRDENTKAVVNDTFTLRCNAYKKFLPYNGFYPSERTTEIVQQFFKSYSGSFEAAGAGDLISDTNKVRPILQALFAPGILYNSIKSGIAVDYPMFTASYDTVDRYHVSDSGGYHTALSSSFSSRLPFEAVYHPYKYLDKLTIVDNEPLQRTRIIPQASSDTKLRNNININAKNKLYIYMINNFLAETQDFFLQNSRPTRILSAPEEDFDAVTPGYPHGMRIRMYRSLNTPQPVSGSWGDYPVPQMVLGNPVKCTAYIYLNKGLAEGTHNFDWYSDLYHQHGANCVSAGPDPNFISLTASIVLSGSVAGSWYASGNGTTTTDTSYNAAGNDFNIGNDNVAGSDNLDATMENLASIISLNPNYNATYLSTREIGYPSLQSNYFCDDREYGEFGIIKVESLYDTAFSCSISNTTIPDNTDNGLDNFFFMSNTLLPVIREDITTQTDSALARIGSGSSTVNGTPIPRETFTMYSRPTAFGPPVAAIATNAESATAFSGAYDSQRGYNTAFTPPYYYGESWLDVVYIPRGTSYVSGNLAADTPYRPKLSTDSSQENSLFVFPDENVLTKDDRNDGLFTKSWRFDKEAGTNPGTDLIMRDGNVNDNSMQLDASIDAFEIVEDENGKKRWSIQLKYETPMLNFAHLTSFDATYYPNGELSSSVPRGMWHQFGRIPQENEGVYLQVGPLPPDWLRNHPSGVIGSNATRGGLGKIGAGNAYGVYNQPSNTYTLPSRVINEASNPRTLNNICGFPSEPVRIGEISQQKKVSEAIVAIPFTENGGQKNFFGIDRARVDMILDIIEGKDINFAPGGQYHGRSEELLRLSDDEKSRLLDNSIGQQLQKMSKYNFPPQFDFINFEEQEAVSMYIFEFEHTFSQDDLSHIWQNVMPELGVKFEKTQASISHPLLNDELLGRSRDPGDISNFYIDMPTKLKWMVFKVKQKAKTDYKKLLGTGELQTEPAFNYNWPYDFFSLVELAQLEPSVGFAPERTTQLSDTKGMIVLNPAEPDIEHPADINYADMSEEAQAQRQESATEAHSDPTTQTSAKDKGDQK